MMQRQDLIRLTLQSIIAHRMRSTLTALGIGIGVTAVVLLTSIGEGVNRYVIDQFTQFGTNTIGIQPGRMNTFGISASVFNSTRPLSLDDAEAIRRAP
jgi:putative ABC transport system permease protein